MTDDTVPVLCQAKLAFPDATSAWDYAKAIRRSLHVQQRPYLCPQCGCYHISSDPRSDRRQLRRTRPQRNRPGGLVVRVWRVVINGRDWRVRATTNQDAIEEAKAIASVKMGVCPDACAIEVYPLPATAVYSRHQVLFDNEGW